MQIITTQPKARAHLHYAHATTLCPIAHALRISMHGHRACQEIHIRYTCIGLYCCFLISAEWVLITEMGNWHDKMSSNISISIDHHHHHHHHHHHYHKHKHKSSSISIDHHHQFHITAGQNHMKISSSMLWYKASVLNREIVYIEIESICIEMVNWGTGV